MPLATRFRGSPQVAYAAGAAVFVGELSLIVAVGGGAMPPFPVLLLAHVVNLCVLLALTAWPRWPFVAVGAVVPAWVAILQWQTRNDLATTWPRLLMVSTTLYAVFAAYPFVVARRARASRDPYLAAVLASAMALFGARAAFVAGGLDWMAGLIPVLEGAVLAVMLRQLLGLESAGSRDLGRLALVAGAALAFVTVAIPLQLEHQWITIGWALEGAALAWLYRRIPHRGLLYSGVALLSAVFARLALNPEVLSYEPRGEMRIFNWYLYTYLLCAVAMFVAGWLLAKTDDRLAGRIRCSSLLPAAGVVLLFLVLNIEIADFYAVGPTIMFRFGVSVAQDLTYTIGWLIFGMGLLAAGIYLRNPAARVAAVALIAVTTFKCFLYDLASLHGLPRVASFVGLAFALALVSLALQKYVPQAQERDMKRVMLLLAAAALAAVPLVGFAQKEPEATYEVPVVTVGPGPQRLAIDSGLLAAGAPFRVRRRGERFYAEDGLTDLRLVTTGGRPVPHLLIQPPAPDREWIPGSILSVAADEEDQRLRGRFRSGARRRHGQGRRPAGSAPEAAGARGQRRSCSLDDARRRGHAVRSAGRTAPSEHARLCPRAVSIPARDLERRQQRPRAEPEGGRRQACHDCAAAATDDDRRVD